jgi:hypothetical protein
MNAEFVYNRIIDGGGMFNYTCTYASATTFTIPNDWTNILNAGTKFELTQSAVVYYGYIHSSTFAAGNTTVTIGPLNNISGTISTLANSAITNVYFGNSARLRKHPIMINYTFAWASSGTAPVIGNATTVARYRLQGNVVHYELSIKFGSTSTFGTGNYTFGLPITSGTLVDTYSYFSGVGTCVKNASTITNMLSLLNPSDNQLYLTTPAGNAFCAPTVPITFANLDVISAQGMYKSNLA